MAPKPKLVTAKALQALLTRIGSASSGIKSVLQERFQRDLQITRLFGRTMMLRRNTSMPKSKTSLRIMSIDMGIKNLAFCDAEVSYSEHGSLNANMKIMRWEKINLVPDTAVTPSSSLPTDPKNVKPGTVDGEEDADLYSLSVLSRTAYRLVKDTILYGSPDVILIEKQRWRSGGGSAIQQWTVRVNTFESMLWAVLRTLLVERQLRFPTESSEKRWYEIYGVDPKRVGYYWLGQNTKKLAGEEAESTEQEREDEECSKKKESRTKMEKKAKIALLRSWLIAIPPSTAPTSCDTTPTISFDFTNNATATLQALTSSLRSSQRKKKSKDSTKGLTDPTSALEIPDTELKKLDDITDCFLQAAAWVSWDLNRLQLQKVWRGVEGPDEQLPELTDEVLRSMVEKMERV
jgi:cruciform cutting endonuclease 1